jgi:hypothetical protein
MDNTDNYKKTEGSHMGHMSLFDKKYLQSKSLYDFSIKKTEKLVTALYMVTDCMDTDDAIKSKLRLLGIELLSKTHCLPSASTIDQSRIGSEALTHIQEIFSLVEIATTLGYVSEMNSLILKKEFTLLSEELGLRFASSSIILDDKLFTVEKISPEERNNIHPQFSVKDIYKGQAPKRTDYKMSFNTKNVLSNTSQTKGVLRSGSFMSKEDRALKIVSLLKDKKEVSIKDISNAFSDCSEKTIQRELNSLIAKGQIKKSGEKRWSRYMLG